MTLSVVSNRTGTALQRRTRPNRPNPIKEDSMAKRQLPDAQLLRKLLRYEPETGKLYWKARAPELFNHEKYADRWNNRFAGAEAFTARDRGYATGTISVRGSRGRYTAHRVIWCMIYGYWPEQVDHADQNRTNNRVQNLRLTDHTRNGRNCRLSNRNRSGRIGVHWSRRRKRWRAKIRHNGRYIELGYFDDFTDACRAREQAERKYGYSTRHGSQ